MTRIAAIVSLIFAGLAQSADPPFKPTLVTADGKSIPAVELIDSIAKQSGIAVDRSAMPKDLKLTMVFKSKPFWEAIQAVADSAKCRIVIRGKGDRLALIPLVAANDSQPATVSGPFRFAVSKVIAKRDFEIGDSTYDVMIDLHWETRIPVFRVGNLTGKVSASFQQVTILSGRSTGIAAQFPPPTLVAESSKATVSGSTHVIAMKVKKVQRLSDSLELKAGSVTVTAAEKMLRMSFDDLTAKQPTKTVEKVTVTLVKWEKIDDFWEARVELTYPPGMPAFESFEAECWLRDNACRLVSPDRSKSFDAKDQLVRITPTGAVIDYRFHEDNKKGIKPGGGGWHLEIDTPSPLKEFAVPFELKGILLP